MFLQACHRRVDREIRAIFTQACINVTVNAYVVKLQDSDRDSSFIRSLEAPIIIEKD